MKLGGFGRMEHFDSIRNAGFDYAELDIPELEALSEKDFDEFKEKVETLGFPVPVGSRILPMEGNWFFTEQFNLLEYRDYLKHACKRAGQLGMGKIILGNGKARKLLDETSIKKEYRFIDFLRMLADIAGENDLEVILEPLGPKYSNYINTLPEAVRIIREAGMSNIFTMADLRHMYWAEEPFEDIVIYAEYVHHIHVDYPKSYPERRFPDAHDDYDYAKFLEALDKAEYRGTLTIEADVPKDWKEACDVAKEVLDYRIEEIINR